MTTILKTLTYKDANRVWWEIHLQSEGFSKSFPDDLEWSWTLYIDNKLLFTGDFVGKRDDIPSELMVISHISNEMIAALLGIAKHGKWN